MNNQLHFPKFTLFASSTILLIAGIGLLGFGLFHLVLSDLSTLYPPKAFVSWAAEVYDENTDFVVMRAKIPDNIPIHLHTREGCESLSKELYKSVPLANLMMGDTHAYMNRLVHPNELDLPPDVSLQGYAIWDYDVQRYARYCYQISAADTNMQPPLRIDHHATGGAMVQSIGLTIASFASLIGGCLLLFLALRLRALGRQWSVLQLAPQP